MLVGPTTDKPILDDEPPPESSSSIQTSDELNELLPALIAARLAFPEFQTNTDGQTGNQTYRYAPLPLVLKSTVPHLAKEGLVIVQAPQILGSSIYLDTKIYHKSGQWIGGELCIKLDPELTGERAAKEIGKAITYMRRYALLPLLGVAADRDDYDAAPERGSSALHANGGGGDPRKTQPSAAPQPREQRPPTANPALSEDDRKKVLDMQTEINVLAAGNEQRLRQINIRITRFKKRNPKETETPWFTGYTSLDSLKSARMVSMAGHNLGELINNDIGLDDEMD